jgi:predicted metal-dependent peptidase
MNSAEQKLKKARVELLLSQPFFGTLSLFLQLKPADWCPSAATDGNTLFFSEDFISELSEEECIFLVGHEVLHCALGHLWRKGMRDKKKWNLAIDYAANDLLLKAGFTPPKCGLMDNRYENMSAEAIYEMLPSHPPNKSYDYHLEQGELLPEGMADLPATDESTWNLRAKSVIDVLKSQGKDPLGVLREIEIHSKSVLDWKSFLSSFFVSMARDDYTWLPPNKKYIGMGFFLPVIRSEKLELAVAVDTSGSISKEDLETFISEIFAITATMPVEITLIACDASVHEMMTFQPYEIPRFPGISGNGGTDFRPVFKRIAQEQLYPACLIYFTDGYGTFPVTEPEYPVIWIIKGHHTVDGKTSVTPWGIEIHLPELEKEAD